MQFPFLKCFNEYLYNLFTSLFCAASRYQMPIPALIIQKNPKKGLSEAIVT